MRALEYSAKKIELSELQDILNDAVIHDNLLSPEILDISIKLDSLIVEYYLEQEKVKEEIK